MIQIRKSIREIIIGNNVLFQKLFLNKNKISIKINPKLYVNTII